MCYNVDHVLQVWLLACNHGRQQKFCRRVQSFKFVGTWTNEGTKNKNCLKFQCFNIFLTFSSSTWLISIKIENVVKNRSHALLEAKI